MHGGVSLRIDGTKPYSFRSLVTWPGTENYDDAVRLGVEEILRERFGNLDQVAIVLESISWDEISSTYYGFNRAARAAILGAFEV
jgi:hypothetical protein